MSGESLLMSSPIAAQCSVVMVDEEHGYLYVFEVLLKLHAHTLQCVVKLFF